MIKKSCSVLVAAFAVSSAVPALAQPAGESWEMSTTMQMQGMTMPMPPNRICLKTGEAAPPPAEKNCKTTNVTVSGNTTSFKVVCGPPEPMEGSGEMTRKGDRMEGRYIMKSKDGEMTMLMSGRKVGACTPPK
jgi:hypothetical protein